jgi:hypothetical protein
MLVLADDERPVGYVPDPLLDHVHAICAHSVPTVTVVRANGPEVGTHLQLLVRLDGQAPCGYAPFAGPGWQAAA